MIHRLRFACKAALWYDEKKSNAGRDEHGAPRFYKAVLLGGPCAVCRRDGRRRRVGPSAGSCPVFPGITARHSDGGIWLLPAVPARRRAGAVRRGGPAHRPALARAVRRRGTGRLRFACFWGTVYFILELAVIGLLKLVWARTRFDDMLAAGDFSRFTSWLRPFGQGGTSFPSGHTASACGIFALLIVCDVSVRFARRRGLIWAVCWAYVAGMALSRMVMGRHFLSDTVMAAGVMALLFVALTHMGAYRRSLAATLALTDAPPGGAA